MPRPVDTAPADHSVDRKAWMRAVAAATATPARNASCRATATLRGRSEQQQWRRGVAAAQRGGGGAAGAPHAALPTRWGAPRRRPCPHPAPAQPQPRSASPVEREDAAAGGAGAPELQAGRQAGGERVPAMGGPLSCLCKRVHDLLAPACVPARVCSPSACPSVPADSAHQVQLRTGVAGVHSVCGASQSWKRVQVWQCRARRQRSGAPAGRGRRPLQWRRRRAAAGGLQLRRCSCGPSWLTNDGSRGCEHQAGPEGQRRVVGHSFLASTCVLPAHTAQWRPASD